MKYPRYPAYKDSGVEWIRAIPKEWNVAKLGNFAKAKSGKRPPLIETHGSIPIYGANGVIGYTNIPMSNELKLLVGRVGSSGAVNIAYPPCWISDNALIIDHNSNVLNFHFLFHLLGLLDYSIEKSNTAQPLITSRALMAKKIPIPPIKDQTKIENFLDEESKKIEKLIKDIIENVEILKEKRQAVITNAVTKGLDPSVPMKKSGVEWIGEIPEKWSLVPIKFIMSANDDVVPESTDPNSQWLYVEISDVTESDGIINFQELQFSEAPTRARRIVKDGDIIISTVRTYLKAIASIKKPEKNTLVSTGFAVLRPRYISQDFAKYALLADYFIDRVISESTGVSYPAINLEKLTSLKIVLPDSDSQREITNYLYNIVIKFNQLIEKHKKMIELLKEYKSSIIFQAVTGKIDVRGFAASTNA